MEFRLECGYEQDYKNDIIDFVDKLKKEKSIGNKYIIRIQERLFLGRYPGAMFIILDSNIDKKIVLTLDKILALRQLMYKKGLLETMIYLAPIGTEVNFNEQGTFIKYPEGFTFETAYKKRGLSHRLIESYTHLTFWNSNLPNQVQETIRTIQEGKGKKNIVNLKLEFNEIYLAYGSLPGFSKIFEDIHGIQLKVFLDIVNEFIFECYPNDNTLGIWKLSELSKGAICKKHKIIEVEKVVNILSNLNRSSVFHGMLVINDTIFSTFERLTYSTLFTLDKCFNTIYENDLKGKRFENATRKLLEEMGLLVLPESVEIFEPMIPKDIAHILWGKEKNRTDLDIIALKENALLIIECKESKFKYSLSKQGNKFKNFVVEQYYRAKWISENFEKFTSYVQNNCDALGINLSDKLLLFPLVVSNPLVNIDNFEGAPLITYSELKTWSLKIGIQMQMTPPKN